MVCCDCIQIVNHCEECHNVTLDYVYDSMNGDRDLCFDCKFNKKEKKQLEQLEQQMKTQRSYKSKFPSYPNLAQARSAAGPPIHVFFAPG